MSSEKHDKHPHGASTIHPSKAGGGGGAQKWLIGAVAAVVVAGGAYAAWQTFGQNRTASESEIASNDPYEDEALRAGPADSESAASDESAAEDAAPAERRAARAPRRAAAVEVPEETIGITPETATAIASAEEGEDIVVRRARPVWASTPSERRLATLYPERARMRGREGEARLQCTVLNGGALDCERVEETSAQFGAAAMRVASSYRHAPTLRDGSDATGTPVNLRVVFRLEDEERRRG